MTVLLKNDVSLCHLVLPYCHFMLVALSFALVKHVFPCLPFHVGCMYNHIINTFALEVPHLLYVFECALIFLFYFSFKKEDTLVDLIFLLNVIK